jgi:GxxExxY protein
MTEGIKATERDPRTYSIIGAAMEVHRELGSGFLEAIYQEALALELDARNIPFEREVELPVRYKGQELGKPYRADFVCFGEVLVELKAHQSVINPDRFQVIHYLKASGLSTGLLINFGGLQLEYQRFAFTHPTQQLESASSV